MKKSNSQIGLNSVMKSNSKCRIEQANNFVPRLNYKKS